MGRRPPEPVYFRAETAVANCTVRRTCPAAQHADDVCAVEDVAGPGGVHHVDSVGRHMERIIARDRVAAGLALSLHDGTRRMSRIARPIPTDRRGRSVFAEAGAADEDVGLAHQGAASRWGWATALAEPRPAPRSCPVAAHPPGRQQRRVSMIAVEVQHVRGKKVVSGPAPPAQADTRGTPSIR